jgi:hypothetical protein
VLLPEKPGKLSEDMTIGSEWSPSVDCMRNSKHIARRCLAAGAALLPILALSHRISLQGAIASRRRGNARAAWTSASQTHMREDASSKFLEVS